MILQDELETYLQQICKKKKKKKNFFIPSKMFMGFKVQILRKLFLLTFLFLLQWKHSSFCIGWYCVTDPKGQPGVKRGLIKDFLSQRKLFWSRDAQITSHSNSFIYFCKYSFEVSLKV